MKPTPFCLLLLSLFLFSPVPLFPEEWPKPPEPGSSPWGSEDERGAANRLTPDKVLEAVRLIRAGTVYPLGRIYEEGMPLFGSRQFNVVVPLPLGPLGKNRLVGLEELLIAEIGQVGTQFDGLGHIGIDDTFYNGNRRPEFQTAQGLTKLGVEKAGVFLTRGVLLDIAALKGVGRLEGGYEITAQDLRDALQKQGLTLRAGDAVLLHTGWGSLWKVDNALYSSGEPGIGIPAAQFLAKQQITLVGSDTWGTEVFPAPDPEQFAPAHQILITLNGIYNLENLDTSELAKDRVYEFAFFFAPLRLKGFTGSPGNPVAVR